MRTVFTDLSYTLRSLRANSFFTLIALATLGTGLGATTALFSVINAVLLEPLPFSDPSRLVLMGHRYQGAIALKTGVSPAGFRFYHDQARVFSASAGVGPWEANYSDGTEPVRLSGQRVTEDYFTTLGVRILHGRGFTGPEMEPGGDRVVVLSELVWRRLFGGNPDIVGRTIRLNDEGYLVIGIATRGLEFGRESIEVWKPLAFTAADLACWGCESIGMVARLRPGVSISVARADLDRVAQAVREMGQAGRSGSWGLWTNPLADEMLGDARTPLLVLAAAVGFVLLIACANVANLLLARATTRRREVAIRTAMGASRGRLLRQLLTESVVLSLTGTTIGLALAELTVRLIRAINPSNLPRVMSIGLDGKVVGFAILLGVMTPLVFGLGPAWYALRGDLFGLVKEGSKGSSEGLGRFGPRAALVSGEIALALMLLVGAGLMIRSLRAWLATDNGFRPESVLTFKVSIPASRYPTVERQIALLDQIQARVGAVPGVERAGASVALPMTNDGGTRTFLVEGHQPGPDGQRAWGEFRFVTPGLFETLGIPVVKGRTFEPSDDARARLVAVVDESLARRYWPGQDPIGKRVGLDRPDGPTWYDVIGVVGHVLTQSPRADRRTQLYIPAAQVVGRRPSGMAFAVKTRSDPATYEGAIRAAVRLVDPVQPIFDVIPMTAWVSASSANQRFLMVTLGGFAAVALILAAVGVYGLMTFAVSQATREIGIRMALGAPTNSVRALVLRRALLLSTAGALVGLAGALALSRTLRSQLFEINPWDPMTLLVVPILLGAVALAAGWLPARRATAVDPIVALRTE